MGTSETEFVRHYQPDKHNRVELINGRVLDVINGRYLDAGTGIILKGGRIESMPGIAGESHHPVDFSIDLKGRTVMPGLFNTHCHLVQYEPTLIAGLSDMRQMKRFKHQQIARNLADCLAHGITNVRDAWQPDLPQNLVLQERISKGELPGPRIQQSVVVGPVGSYMQEKLALFLRVSGMPHIDDPARETAGAVAFPANSSEQQVRDAVDRAIDERGADVIKIGDESYSLFSRKSVPVMSDDQLHALADQARRRGVQSTMHHSSVASFRRGMKAGVSSLVHTPWDALLTREDAEIFKRSGCISEPTVSAFYGMLSWKVIGGHLNDDPELVRLTEFRDSAYTFADIAEEHYIPELRDIVLNGYRQYSSGKPKMMGLIDASGMAAWSEKIGTYFHNFCLLYEYGAPMATSNDNKPPCTPAMMNLELLMFDHLLRGKPDGKQLDGTQAVRIATINSARSLGLDKEFGSIETGKTADLVILDGDPLQDFRLIGGRVAALFMDGELVINNCGLDVKSIGKLKD